MNIDHVEIVRVDAECIYCGSAMPAQPIPKPFLDYLLFAYGDTRMICRPCVQLMIDTQLIADIEQAIADNQAANAWDTCSDPDCTSCPF